MNWCQVQKRDSKLYSWQHSSLYLSTNSNQWLYLPSKFFIKGLFQAFKIKESWLLLKGRIGLDVGLDIRSFRTFYPDHTRKTVAFQLTFRKKVPQDSKCQVSNRDHLLHFYSKASLAPNTPDYHKNCNFCHDLGFLWQDQNLLSVCAHPCLPKYSQALYLYTRCVNHASVSGQGVFQRQ